MMEAPTHDPHSTPTGVPLKQSLEAGTRSTRIGRSGMAAPEQPVSMSGPSPAGTSQHLATQRGTTPIYETILELDIQHRVASPAVRQERTGTVTCVVPESSKVNLRARNDLDRRPRTWGKNFDGHFVLGKFDQTRLMHLTQRL